MGLLFAVESVLRELERLPPVVLAVVVVSFNSVVEETSAPPEICTTSFLHATALVNSNCKASTSSERNGNVCILCKRDCTSLKL